MAAVRIVTLLLALHVAAAGLLGEAGCATKDCGRGKVCLSLGSFFPTCVDIPPAVCPCSKILRPVECEISIYRWGFTRTGSYTASNSCVCECSGGTPATIPDPLICPAVIDPVCCRSGNKDTTTQNSCICSGDGGSVISKGPCVVAPPVEDPVSKPEVCAAVFDPVCCNVDGVRETKSNDCICKQAGGMVLTKGECKEKEEVACITLFDPVCCRINGVDQTESNDCFCGAAGGTVVSGGECAV